MAKPTYKEIFGYKLLIFPWTIILWIKDWIMWILKYWILRKEYDTQAQIYLTKKSLQLSDRKWEVSFLFNKEPCLIIKDFSLNEATLD